MILVNSQLICSCRISFAHIESSAIRIKTGYDHLIAGCNRAIEMQPQYSISTIPCYATGIYSSTVIACIFVSCLRLTSCNGSVCRQIHPRRIISICRLCYFLCPTQGGYREHCSCTGTVKLRPLGK